MRTLRTRLAAEGGFTMIVVMLALMTSLVATGAAYMAVQGDTRSSAYNEAQKVAYAAAESGLNWYQTQLAKDPEYWTRCAAVPTVSGHAAPVWDGLAATAATGRVWADVGDETLSYTGTPPAARAVYNVELVPASGSNACSTTNPSGTMIDAFGTFRIRISGRYGGATRAIVATFRRKGFLDYLYYTQFETLDPTLSSNALGIAGWPTRLSATDATTFDTWASANCSAKYGTRSGKTFAGQFDPPATYGWTTFTPAPTCTDVSFSRDPTTGTGDTVAGPLHTVDPLLVCGNPIFGTAASDKIEVEPNAVGMSRNAAAEGIWGCPSGWGSSPQFTGTANSNADPITPPAPNVALASAATGGFLFQGKTRVVLKSDGTMDIYNAARYGSGSKNVTQPTNGVIYALTSGTCSGYDPQNVDSNESACGDIRVSGTAKTSLTFGADNDIVITGDLKPDATTPNALIGLIAQNGYVRVWHPIGTTTTDTVDGYRSAAQTATQLDSVPAGQPRSYCNTNNAATPAALNTITIQAAILALTHSFVVDNWRCGTRMTGSLNVTGAIAQKFRGPVGCNACKPGSNPLGATGYAKNYVYDTRLKYRSPPSFLAPTQSSWRLMRVQEQGAATKITGR